MFQRHNKLQFLQQSPHQKEHFKQTHMIRNLWNGSLYIRLQTFPIFQKTFCTVSSRTSNSTFTKFSGLTFPIKVSSQKFYLVDEVAFGLQVSNCFMSKYCKSEHSRNCYFIWLISMIGQAHCLNYKFDFFHFGSIKNSTQYWIGIQLKVYLYCFLQYNPVK